MNPYVVNPGLAPRVFGAVVHVPSGGWGRVPPSAAVCGPDGLASYTDDNQLLPGVIQLLVEERPAQLLESTQVQLANSMGVLRQMLKHQNGALVFEFKECYLPNGKAAGLQIGQHYCILRSNKQKVNRWN